MHKILVKIGNLELEAEISGENPGTAERVLESLPVQGEARRWGEEIYFLVGFGVARENARQECKPGEIGFWPDGPGIAIFFGKTPVSTNGRPRAYSPCNFFARLSGKWDRGALNKVRDGEKVVPCKAKQGLTST